MRDELKAAVRAAMGFPDAPPEPRPIEPEILERRRWLKREIGMLLRTMNRKVLQFARV